MFHASFNPNIPNFLYYLDYRVYSRPFRIPLHTHHGEWSERQGVLIKLTTELGQSGFGEIAPLPWFGSETVEEALELCRALGPLASASDLLTIPDDYPASQFGIESAIESIQSAIAQSQALTQNGSHLFANPAANPAAKPAFQTPIRLSDPIPTRRFTPTSPICHLLPTGASALTAWQHPWSKGVHSFKWKIGVSPIRDELALFEQLLQTLPPATTLRLDANGGLSWEMACQWLELCDQFNGSGSDPLEHPPGQYHSHGVHPSIEIGSSIAPTIEFLEQPLPPDRFEDLMALAQTYQTPLALDESVSTFIQLEQCYGKGWRGIFVIKAAIAGFPKRLRRFCQQHDLDIVWSSALETAIARQFITHHLIPTVPSTNRPLGFGVNQWFEPSALDQTEAEALWESCSNSDC